MEIEGVLKSELLQIMPFDFGRKLADVLLNDMMNAAPASTPTPPVSRVPVAPPPAPLSCPRAGTETAASRPSFCFFACTKACAGSREREGNAVFFL